MSDPIDRYFGQSAEVARATLPAIDHYGTPIYGPLGDCLYCAEPLFDGALVSGWTKGGPDLCTAGGDFGCDDSPETTRDGVGGHAIGVHR